MSSAIGEHLALGLLESFFPSKLNPELLSSATHYDDKTGALFNAKGEAINPLQQPSMWGRMLSSNARHDADYNTQFQTDNILAYKKEDLMRQKGMSRISNTMDVAGPAEWANLPQDQKNAFLNSTFDVLGSSASPAQIGQYGKDSLLLKDHNSFRKAQNEISSDALAGRHINANDVNGIPEITSASDAANLRYALAKSNSMNDLLPLANRAASTGYQADIFNNTDVRPNMMRLAKTNIANEQSTATQAASDIGLTNQTQHLAAITGLAHSMYPTPPSDTVSDVVSPDGTMSVGHNPLAVSPQEQIIAANKAAEDALQGSQPITTPDGVQFTPKPKARSLNVYGKPVDAPTPTQAARTVEATQAIKAVPAALGSTVRPTVAGNLHDFYNQPASAYASSEEGRPSYMEAIDALKTSGNYMVDGGVNAIRKLYFALHPDQMYTPVPENYKH